MIITENRSVTKQKRPANANLHIAGPFTVPLHTRYFTFFVVVTFDHLP